MAPVCRHSLIPECDCGKLVKPDETFIEQQHRTSIDKSNQSDILVPAPRSGHRVVCDDGNMYSFGGYLETDIQWPDHLPPWPAQLCHGPQKLFQELWCYNFATEKWKLLPTPGDPPRELASHSAVLHGNHLLVFGGTGVPFGGSSSNKMNICDLRTLEWKCAETKGPPPVPQYGQAVVLDEESSSFFVIGGTTGYNYSLDVHKLNLKTLTWEALFFSKGDAEEPRPRYRHEVAYYKDCIYVLGGGTASEAYDLQNVSRFNVITRNWETIGTSCTSNGYPSPRKCQGSVQLDHEVFICGGYDSRNIFFDVWKLELPTLIWRKLSVTMPVPLYFHSTCLTKAGCMYVFGGVTDISKNKRTNKVFKIWLKVPSLKEMSWESLLHYKRVEIASLETEALLQLGIPSDLVDRVHPAPPSGLVAGTNPAWTSKYAEFKNDPNGNNSLDLNVFLCLHHNSN